MEIFQDLVFTISFSLIVSLLLAKLFSVSSSSDDNKCYNKSSSKESVLFKEMDQPSSLACDYETEYSVQENSVDYVEIQNDELLREVEVVGLEDIDTKCEFDKEESEYVGHDEITERSKVSEIEVELDDADVVEILDDDDDWEGIERTELEKVFWDAVAFLGSNSSDDRLSMISNEVKMQLYGLYKVATQGPCCESQPMAIKVSARANWNAWKRVGNISPEEAMEQYIALLSRHVPDWLADNSSKNVKMAHLVDGTTGELPSYSDMHMGSEMKGTHTN